MPQPCELYPLYHSLLSGRNILYYAFSTDQVSGEDHFPELYALEEPNADDGV